MLMGCARKAPQLGAGFGAWGGLFSTFDCIFAMARRKEDPWNAIGSGAITGGVLAMRGGWRIAVRSAIGGAVILAMIEGVQIYLLKMNSVPDQSKMTPVGMPPGMMGAPGGAQNYQ